MARGISPETNGGASLGSSAKNWATVHTQAVSENADMGNNGSLGYRQPSTAYAVGNIAYHSALSMQKLVCVQGGTTASGDVAPSTTEGALVTDGTVVWQVDSLADGNYTSIHQNGIAGGRDITAYWQSGIMSTNIQAGIFVGMHIGDHIVKTITTAATTYTDKSGVEQSQPEATYSNRNWIVAGMNSQFKVGNGDEGQGTTQNHIVLISDTAMQASVKMNPTNDTTGGYLGSDMWRIHMPIWANAIKNAFGDSHVLTHRELLSNAINSAGTASNFAWVDVDINIPNEVMVQGVNLLGTFIDTTTWASQLPYFALLSRLITNIHSSYWLRDVAESTGFAVVDLTGYTKFAPAGESIAYGSIRPYFLIH